jgi:hypothetical protein
VYFNKFRRTVGSIATIVVACVCCSAAPAHGSQAFAPRHDGASGTYLLRELAAACGFGAPVSLGRGPVSYAKAMTIDDRAIILYNPKSLDALERETGTPWSSVSVLAHELGHHFYGHTHQGMLGAESDSIPQHELDADYFSGYAIARVGGTLQNAQAAQRTLKSDETLYHPSSARRLHAIRAGWLDGAAGFRISPEPGLRMERESPVRALMLRASSSAIVLERLSLLSGQW